MFRFLVSFFVLFILVLSASVTQATIYERKPDQMVVGKISYYTVNDEDTFYSIARKFDLGIVELLTANPGIDPWLPPIGSVLIAPTMHVLPNVKQEGIIINLAELRLFYFPDAETVLTFPIGIGKEGWRTPLGNSKITLKRKDPTWIPPPSIRAEDSTLPAIVPPGPDNPLGAYALNLSLPLLAIHGTDKPYGIGLRSSHGCIRLYPEDIETLFNLVQEGTKVKIMDEPYKLGWRDHTLFLEISPTQLQTDLITESKKPAFTLMPEMYKDILTLTGDAKKVHWLAAEEAVKNRHGIPIPIFVRNP